MKLSTKFSLALGLALIAGLAVACGDGQPAEPGGEPDQTSSAASPGPAGQAGAAKGDVPARPTLTKQGVVGQTLFKAHCAQCHGTSVAISAFDTAADLATYIGTNMPRNAPGSLTQSEYFSIAAFDLVENGVDLKGLTLDAANAGSVSVR